MNRQTIAYIDHARQLGGAQRSLVEIIDHLDRDAFRPVLVCSEGADWLDRDEIADVEKVGVFDSRAVLDETRDNLSVSLLRSAGHVLRAGRPVWSLSKALRAVEPDIIHTNTLKTHLLGAAVVKFTPPPLVWHLRDLLSEAAARRWLHRAANWGRPHIIAISNAVAGQLQDQAQSPTIVHNGIPLKRFTPGAPDPQLRRDLGISSDDHIVAIISRLTPWKGHRELLRAIAKIAEAITSVQLLVVGEVAFWEAEYDRQLKQLADELSIADRVHWLGFREDVTALLRLCDVFALPSEDEPFGRAIIEAMATGKPVVATRSGGVPEIVRDTETGLLVEHGDVEGLAAAIQELLADSERAEQMGRAAAEDAHSRFNIQRVADSVQNIYRQLANG